MSLTLIDATSTSLTVSWPSVPGAVRYVLQYRRAEGEDSSADGDAYETLSDKLTSTQARKRNLADDSKFGFVFRVRAATSEDDNKSNDEENCAGDKWMTHLEPFRLLTVDDADRPKAPTVTTGVGNHAALIQWSGDKASKYEIQMRENDGGVPWNTIAPSFLGTEVRKKNLTSKLGYQFRIRPAPTADSGEGDSSVPFSSPSDPVVAPGLSDGMMRMFSKLEENVLLQNPGSKRIKLDDALGGKEFVLLYASAHWCGPCRQFTPQLVNWYQSAKRLGNVEVVFLSADHDERGFEGYFKSMPWLAVPYDDDAREGLMSYIRVTGIPRLVVLEGRTGRILEDNAVGKPLDIGQWRRLASSGK